MKLGQNIRVAFFQKFNFYFLKIKNVSKNKKILQVTKSQVSTFSRHISELTLMRLG